MAFVLIFGTLHIAAHDLGDNNDPQSLHEECEICRLNQLAKDIPPAPSFVTLFGAVVIVFPLPNSVPPLQRLLRLTSARSPPRI
jgi:hypothetical protein